MAMLSSLVQILSRARQYSRVETCESFACIPTDVGRVEEGEQVRGRFTTLGKLER